MLGIARVSDDFFDELADLLVEGDLGAGLVSAAADELKIRCRSKGLNDGDLIRAELKAVLASYGKEARFDFASTGLDVVLVLGVNGVGKTTTCAKIARRFRESGSGVVLAACDTFRAAATEQLKLHGERLGVRVVSQGEGADPGAVLYDALDAARADGAGLLVADTAGRMHTKQNLVRELGKLDKIALARVPPGRLRKLLVVDSTTGQNALRQAESFAAAVSIDALILSKYDSTAKGGVALAIAKELGIPTAFVGTGEGVDDFSPFTLDAYLDEMTGSLA
ncbi:MAG: signal recognition particle-docking protein FtsY [Spirochaetales bacterium]|nr:signal recognition particle-docking protein FtsY [Spirochaetales bacterium]